MVRYVRLAAVVFSAVVCLSCCALWLRSQLCFDRIQLSFGSQTCNFILTSDAPTIVGSNYRGADRNTLETPASFGSVFESIGPIPDTLGFRWYTGKGFWLAAVPHWFPVVLAGGVAVALGWPMRRFSLRTMLIAVTVVAVVLGTMVATAP